MEVKETGCCKPFDPKPWDKKTVVLKDKLFLKAHAICFMHIPLNFGGVMKKSMDKIFAAKAEAKTPLMLSDECSPWGSNIYIAVSKDVPGAEMTKISGTFLSKVYEGEYKNVGTWVKDIQEYVKSKGKVVKKLYFFYTMCPACAKAYGQNYTVILAEV